MRRDTLALRTLSAPWSWQDADLVLLEGNPLEDIRNTRKISAVVVNGKIFGKPELQKIFDYALRNSVKKRP